eukprot:TRINITY_DN8882_c0_g1_i1.p1 TRINITY_DN8882_c0_g1~~TRINITY_DN8882_c0_g1_i1.p1  ORF type:complete len:1066 (+),score=278.98 TRINITY_DN8882_c0_g1_i1:240-3437(+)
MASGPDLSEFLDVLGLADAQAKFSGLGIDSVDALSRLDDAAWLRIGLPDDQKQMILGAIAACSIPDADTAATDTSTVSPACEASPPEPEPSNDPPPEPPAPASAPTAVADADSTTVTAAEPAAEPTTAPRNFITQKRALVRREDNKRVIPVDERSGVTAEDAPLRLPSTRNMNASTSARMASDVYPQHGIESCQGRRKTMEDTHKAMDSLQKDSCDLCPPGADVSYYAVFDGHNGTEAAAMCESIFHGAIFDRPAFKEGQVETALVEGFSETDKRVLAVSAEENWKSGCTALVCLRVAQPGSLGTMYVANVGDSEAIIAKRSGAGFEFEQLSHKHKPKDASERDRVKAAGGMIIMGRVMGTLAVARAIGDRDYKAPWNGVTENFVSAEPFVRKLELAQEHEFVILSCDGLWEKMAYQEAVDLVAASKDEGLAAEVACRALVARALELGSLDNVTAVVVYLTPSKLPEKPAPASTPATPVTDGVLRPASAGPSPLKEPLPALGLASSSPVLLSTDRPRSATVEPASAPRGTVSSPSRRLPLSDSESTTSSQRIKGKSGLGRTLDTLKRAFADDYMRRKEMRRRTREECKDEGRRVQSFTTNTREWPWLEALSPEKMAAAGFYFAPTKRRPDRVKCYVCDVSLHKWVGKDDPKLEHVKVKSSCDLASSWPNYDPVAIVNKRKPFEAIRRKMNDFFRERQAKKRMTKNASNFSTTSEYDASDESGIEPAEQPRSRKTVSHSDDLRRVQSDSRISAKFLAPASSEELEQRTLSASSPKSRSKSKLRSSSSAELIKAPSGRAASLADSGTAKDVPASSVGEAQSSLSAPSSDAAASVPVSVLVTGPVAADSSVPASAPVPADSSANAVAPPSSDPSADAPETELGRSIPTPNGPSLESSNISPPQSPSLAAIKKRRNLGSPRKPHRANGTHSDEGADGVSEDDEGSAVFVLREDSHSDINTEGPPTSLVFRLDAQSVSDGDDEARPPSRHMFPSESSTGELDGTLTRGPQLSSSTGEAPAITRTSPEKPSSAAVTLLASSSGGGNSLSDSVGGRGADKDPTLAGSGALPV